MTLKKKPHIVCMGILLAGLCLPATALGKTLSQLILQRTDTPDKATSEQIDEWIAEAEKGNWAIKAEFAAAYLFRERCQELQYGHRCRAMAAKPEIGDKFLFEIIDMPNNSKEIRKEPPQVKNSRYLNLYDQQDIQREYAQARLIEALSKRKPGPGQKADPEDPACKDYLKYETLAAESGSACAAQGVRGAYLTGTCAKEDAVKADLFKELGLRCPVQ